VRIFSDSETGRALFHWDTRRARSANPIAWLQEYSWGARLAKWGWFSVALLVEVCVMYLYGSPHRSSRQAAVQVQELFSTVLICAICLAGANSFRTERVTGAMELLLVSPLTPLQIVLGRLWGIWVHFFPAVFAVAFIWLSAGRFLSVNSSDAYLLISSYLFLPMLGLYISLFSWHLLVAWPVIFLSGVVVPIFVAQLVSDTTGNSVPVALIVAILVQAAAGGTALAVLRKKLERRSFAFN
jgi:hypothetical protein